VRATTAARVADLPLLHRDPFDRLLIAQAIEQPAALYTADDILTGYTDLVQRVGRR
jgi:PIN domain nuclease of toxin-antitoxin system